MYKLIDHHETTNLSPPCISFLDENDSEWDMCMLCRVKFRVIEGVCPFLESRKWLSQSNGGWGLAVRFNDFENVLVNNRSKSSSILTALLSELNVEIGKETSRPNNHERWVLQFLPKQVRQCLQRSLDQVVCND